MPQIKKLRVILTLASGMQLEREWGPREILPESLRGQIAIPSWARNARKEESPGLLVLKADVAYEYESEAAHWIGYE